MSAAPTPAGSPGEDRPFWAAAADGRLALPYCPTCASHFWPAADRCPRCLGAVVEWRASSGTGTVYSVIVYHHAYSEELAREVPYNVCLIELDEGPRIPSRVVGVPADQVRIGQRAWVDFQELRGVVAPVFRLVEAD